jgi:hypothetical protein
MKYRGTSFTPAEITARRIELERIQMFSGRPDRQTIINQDDCIDLSIALHQTTSVEEFLTKI